MTTLGKVMPLLKDLVPGSKSDRLSFHSDTFSVSEDHQQQDDLEEGVAPARPARGFTPKGSTPCQPIESKGTPSKRSRSRENFKSGASDKASERQEQTIWYTCLLSLFSTIFNYLRTKLKRTFKDEVGTKKTIKKTPKLIRWGFWSF